MNKRIPSGLLALVLSATAAQASDINEISDGMPNRISMNVTVPRQTQGSSFGERMNAGLQAAGGAVAQGAAAVVIECGRHACAVAFPDGSGYRADLQAMSLAPLSTPEAAHLREQPAGARLVGGALPGGAILSAAVSSVSTLGTGGGAASAGYAATGRMQATDAPLRSSPGEQGSIDVLDPLVDGDYLLTVELERAAGRVRMVFGFRVAAGVLKARHDTARNSIANLR